MTRFYTNQVQGEAGRVSRAAILVASIKKLNPRSLHVSSRQEANTRAMATVQGAELREVIVDGGESAKNLNRPGLQHSRSFTIPVYNCE